MVTQAFTQHYESSNAHLWDELALLDLRLLREVQRVRRISSGALGEEFRGLLVSENHIDALLEQGVLNRNGSQADSRDLPLRILALQQTIESRIQTSLEQGIPLRLKRLQDIFHLSSWDAGVLILCLAPEVDLHYETLYAYLQDDVGKKRPTVNLALTLLCDNLEERVARRKSFGYSGSLLRHELVQISEDTYSKDGSFLAQVLRLDPRITNFLLGIDALDSRLLSAAHSDLVHTSWDDVVLSPDILSDLNAFREHLGHWFPEQPGPLLQLVGPRGSGKKTLARALSKDLAKPLLIVDIGGSQESESPPEKLVRLAFREALLQNAVLYWENFHLLFNDDSQHRALQQAMYREFSQRFQLTIIAGEVPWRLDQGLEELSMFTVHLPLPEFPERRILWEICLDAHQNQISPPDLALIASKFNFSGGQIKRVVATGRDLAQLRFWQDPVITSEDLYVAARWHSGQRLSVLAQKIQVHYSWDDIVLPLDQKTQLREMCGYIANRSVVYGQWGFQRKSNLGKGLNVLFAGPSGTGKTMSAEIMAGELGLDLYKIDLSSIVSKYIGETEKNLDRIFREAQDSNAILFFDEADALFGKRSEVRDSHDRYANIEISYLLQKMEEYQGIVILATNFRKNIDEAFVRRLHVAVEFPFPEEEYRLQIWQQIFPSEAPLDDTVDLSFLARHFKAAGGNIKNIAVSAAFLAAQEGTAIGMRHMIWATKREYQKIGRLLVESEFGPYFELARGSAL